MAKKYGKRGNFGALVDDPYSDVTEEKTVTKDANGNETTVIRKNAENNPTKRFEKFKQQQEQSSAQTAAPAKTGGAGTGGRKAMGGNRPVLSKVDMQKGAGRGGRKGRDFIDEALFSNDTGGRASRGYSYDEPLEDQGGSRGSRGYGFDEPLEAQGGSRGGRGYGFDEPVYNQRGAHRGGRKGSGQNFIQNDIYDQGGAGRGGRKGSGNDFIGDFFSGDTGAHRGGRKGENFIDESLFNQSGGRDGRGYGFDEPLPQTGAHRGGRKGSGNDFIAADLFGQQQNQRGAHRGGVKSDLEYGNGGRGARGYGFDEPLDTQVGAGRGGRKGNNFIDELLFDLGSGGRGGRDDNFIDESLFDQGSGGRSSNGPGQDFGFDEYFPTPEEMQREEMDNAQVAAGKQGFAPLGREANVSDIPQPTEKLGFAEAAALNAVSGDPEFDNLGTGHPGNFAAYEAPVEPNAGRGDIVEQGNERGDYTSQFDPTYGSGGRGSRGTQGIDEELFGQTGGRGGRGDVGGVADNEADQHARWEAFNGRPVGGEEVIGTGTGGGDTPIESRFDQFEKQQGVPGQFAQTGVIKNPDWQPIQAEHRALQASTRNQAKLDDVEKQLSEIEENKADGTLASTKLGGNERNLQAEYAKLTAKQEELDVKHEEAATTLDEVEGSNWQEFDAPESYAADLGDRGAGMDTDEPEVYTDGASEFDAVDPGDGFQEEDAIIETDQDIIDADDGEENATQALAAEIAGPGGSTGSLTAAESSDALMKSDTTLTDEVQQEAANIVSQSPKAQDALKQIGKRLVPQDWEKPEQAVKKSAGFLDGLFGGNDPMMQQAIMSMLIGWLSTGSIAQGASMGLQAYQGAMVAQQETAQAKIDADIKLKADNKKERLSLKKAGYTNESIETYQATGDFNMLKDAPTSKDPVQLKKDGYTDSSIKQYQKSGEFTDLKKDTYKEKQKERLELLNKGYSKESIKAYQTAGGDINKLVKTDATIDPEKQRLDLKKSGYTNASVAQYQQSKDVNDLVKSVDTIKGKPDGSKWVGGKRVNYWNSDDGNTYFRGNDGEIMQAATSFENVEEYDKKYHSASARNDRIRTLSKEYAAAAMENIPSSEKMYNPGVSATRIQQGILNYAKTYGLDAANLGPEAQVAVGLAVEEMADKNRFLHKSNQKLEKNLNKYINSNIIRSTAIDANVPTGSFITDKTGEVNHEAISTAYKVVRQGTRTGRSDTEVWSILSDSFSQLSEGQLKDAKKGGKKHKMSPFLYYVNNTSFTN